MAPNSTSLDASDLFEEDQPPRQSRAPVDLPLSEVPLVLLARLRLRLQHQDLQLVLRKLHRGVDL